MFKREFKKLWLLDAKGMQQMLIPHGGITGALISNSLFNETPKPINSLFFKTYYENNLVSKVTDTMLKTGSIITAPVVFFTVASLSAISMIGYTFEALIDLAMLNPTKAAEDSKMAVASLFLTVATTLAMVVSPLINLIHTIIGGETIFLSEDREMGYFPDEPEDLRVGLQAI
jgi:hypothetical protein